MKEIARSRFIPLNEFRFSHEILSFLPSQFSTVMTSREVILIFNAGASSKSERVSFNHGESFRRIMFRYRCHRAGPRKERNALARLARSDGSKNVQIWLESSEGKLSIPL